MSLPVKCICHCIPLKICIDVMWWQWSYHFTPLFVLVKRTVSPYMLQYTSIVHVRDYNRFSQCTTTVYSIVSKEIEYCFFQWNITSMKNSFINYIDHCILSPPPPSPDVEVEDLCLFLKTKNTKCSSAPLYRHVHWSFRQTKEQHLGFQRGTPP